MYIQPVYFVYIYSLQQQYGIHVQCTKIISKQLVVVGLCTLTLYLKWKFEMYGMYGMSVIVCCVEVFVECTGGGGDYSLHGPS